MSKRPLDEQSTELEVALLEAGREVPPPPDKLLERTLVAVSIAGSVAASGSAAASSAGAATAIKVSGAAGVAKSALVGGLFGVLVAGSGFYLEYTSSRTPSSDVGKAALVTAAPSSSLAARPIPVSEPPSAVPSAEPVPNALPVAPLAGASTPKKTGDLPPSELVAVSGPTGAMSLAPELALLDAARRALDGGNPARSIALLDQYASEFPRGRLAPEARVLRIEATAQHGDRAEANRLAREFLRDDPESPHAERVHRLEAVDSGTSNP